MKFEDILEINPYSLTKEKKTSLLTERLLELTDSHRKNCKAYSDILDACGYDEHKTFSYKDIPYLPVRLFKELDLKSIADEDIIKTMTSSGTSGQKTSKIYLDRVTSANQQKAMVKIVNDFTGSSRMPMIIIDCPSVIKDRRMFSARGAGILGFSVFGSKKIYALNDNMQLDFEGIKAFLEEYKGQKILLFGFTFMIWQYFYKELLRLSKKGISLDLSNAVMIHGGGWKKLISEAVTSTEFSGALESVCGIRDVHDYYGMVEQTGCIYMQCECGHLHASIFSDVITRRPIDFSECEIGERGILQVVSTIPESYPGHSLLTEDEGTILGEDDCPCGRKGKYFEVHGRLKSAEIRGCSDTFSFDDKVNSEDSSGNDIWGKVKFLIGSKETVLNISEVSPKPPFAEEIIQFMDILSKELIHAKEVKAFPDIVTLGFWLRKASVLKMKERYGCDDNNEHIGRGVVFHIAPSNVPVNYAYSLFTGLLCGNANIVRIPSKDYPQVSIINCAIAKVLKEFEDLRRYIILVKYDRDQAINDYFSSCCDVRVIWGGDSSIKDIRKSQLQPRATEITFADRYSLSVIDSDAVMEEYAGENNNKFLLQLSGDFYNDTYLSDQNACTSPRVVVWVGNRIAEAKEIFWKSLHELVTKKYFFQPIQGVDKLSMKYIAASSYEDKMAFEEANDNLLARINVNKLLPSLMEYRGNSGYFYEYDCYDILKIRDFCNDTHCQTIGYFGNIESIAPLLKSGIRGVDRVVPIGHTMDFDLIWDGYNLVERLTRSIGVEYN